MKQSTKEASLKEIINRLGDDIDALYQRWGDLRDERRRHEDKVPSSG